MNLKEDDSMTHDYLSKSIQFLLKKPVSCVDHLPAIARINIASTKLSPGYLFIAQDENLCFLTPTTDNVVSTQIQIIPAKSIMTIYHLSESTKHLLKTKFILEAQEDKTYNVQIDYNKEKNYLSNKLN